MTKILLLQRNFQWAEKSDLLTKTIGFL